MNSEPAALDPREVKVLADILALVLEDQPGSSAVALETLRRKAQQNRVTGGALKNLFQSIAAKPTEWTFRVGDWLPETPEALRDGFERLRAANRTLEKALAAANTEAARLQADLDDAQARLAEAHRHNRGLAERWRTGRRQTTYLAGAIGLFCLVIGGLAVDRVVASYPPAPMPVAVPARHVQPQARTGLLPRRAAAVAHPPAAAEPAPAATAERDPELEQALQRLSRTTALDRPPHPATDPPTSLPPPSPAVPAPLPAGMLGRLSPGAYNAIVSHVRTCWRGYVSRLADPRFKARLQVVTDESGVVRQAALAADERARLADPSFQTYVRAAMRAVLDPDCAQLPIPPADLGHRIVFDFVFVP